MEPIIPITVINIVKLSLWIGIGIWGWSLAKDLSLAKHIAAEQKSSFDIGNWFYQQKIKIALFTIALMILITFTQTEYAYRPKTTFPPVDPIIQQQMQEIDNREFILRPSQADEKDKAIMENYSERNREENKRAQESFKSINTELDEKSDTIPTADE